MKNFIALPPSEIEISKTAQIDISGSFIFNRKWSKVDPFPSLFTMGDHAQLIVDGVFSVFSGSRVSINSNAILKLGSGYINNGLNLACFEKIEIGHEVAISENVSIRDSDNHQILDGNHTKTAPIKIGNHVWIGMNVTILKGVEIGDGCVIAAGSVVNKSIPKNCMAGGVPAKVLKENIHWK
ncbi:acyltransferase [Ornithobacterium rhinotracheale]|uniref:acyltransferase n=1 Tax=Ornithobacterium rhinotracheale TaxID=28251 RepID=UPI0040368613